MSMDLKNESVIGFSKRHALPENVEALPPQLGKGYTEAIGKALFECREDFDLEKIILINEKAILRKHCKDAKVTPRRRHELFALFDMRVWQHVALLTDIQNGEVEAPAPIPVRDNIVSFAEKAAEKRGADLASQAAQSLETLSGEAQRVKE